MQRLVTSSGRCACADSIQNRSRPPVSSDHEDPLTYWGSARQRWRPIAQLRHAISKHNGARRPPQPMPRFPRARKPGGPMGLSDPGQPLGPHTAVGVSTLSLSVNCQDNGGCSARHCDTLSAVIASHAVACEESFHELSLRGVQTAISNPLANWPRT